MSGSFNDRFVPGDFPTAAEINKVGLIVIGDTTLGVDTADMSIASIPGGFGHLLIVASLRSSGSTNNPEAKIRFNDDSGTNYVDANGSSETSGHIGFMAEDDIADALYSTHLILVPAYASAVYKKTWMCAYAVRGGITTPAQAIVGGNWVKSPIAAITKVTVLPSVDSLNAGSRLTVYGMNDAA